MEYGSSEYVVQLAAEVTADCDSKYEKVQAIINHLKKSGEYVYSKEVILPPKEQNRIDYFLQETKEGYCKYFATAATLLLREAGIPARYVEGVVVDYSQAEDGWYKVYGEASHAWTQVYLTGLGWMDVDATPLYQTVRGNWKKPVDTETNYEDPHKQMGHEMKRLLRVLRSRGGAPREKDTIRTYGQLLLERGCCSEKTYACMLYYEKIRFSNEAVLPHMVKQTAGCVREEQKQLIQTRWMRRKKLIRSREKKAGKRRGI